MLNSVLDVYSRLWEHRDRRVDHFPLMSSPLPTLFICSAYIFIVKVWGPWYMKDRPAYNIRPFLLIYNLIQVAISTIIFISLCINGWGTNYSWKCQPVDYSNSPQAVNILIGCYMYYLSKFTEFFDTFAFVARKKFSHISLLHVVHHGIMPLSVWPGVRWVGGGHASFFGLLNTFIHIFMYTYYFMAALGPQYSKFVWWKQHMTTLQMIQFVGIMTHGFQLLFRPDCGFPKAMAYYIAAHAVLFFILFAQFYVREYIFKKDKKVEGEGKEPRRIDRETSSTASTPTTVRHRKIRKDD